MSTAGEQLRAYIAADPQIAAIVSDRVHQQMAPNRYEGPYIWFAQYDSDYVREIDGVEYEPYERNWDLECIARDIQTAYQLEQDLRKRLPDGFRGRMAGGFVHALFTNEHESDYIPRGVAFAEDEGVFVQHFRIDMHGFGMPA